jgi:hypothetical protein
MSFDLSTDGLLAGVAVALGVVLVLLGVAWAVVWLLTHRD